MQNDIEQVSHKWLVLHEERCKTLVQEAYGPNRKAKVWPSLYCTILRHKIREAMQFDVIKPLPFVMTEESRVQQGKKIGSHRHHQQQHHDLPTAHIKTRSNNSLRNNH